MMALLPFLALFASAVRSVVAVAVVILAIAFLLDWLVRTRRINPFHPMARVVRRFVDPLVTPIERRIVRAGGSPSSAPIWALVGAVFIGIVIISGLDFVLQGLVSMIFAASSGPLGLFVMLVRLTFDILRLAIIIVVLVSWLPISPFSAWVRWAFAITEPLLRPLRDIVPRLGMFDITPIVAYFLLGILEWAFLRMAGM
ncbi:MAG TPA: YggT family protein [Gemmatimonadaceae bacterium]|nr:YggT family protein [Gemmatimonadaceae bacterium]